MLENSTMIQKYEKQMEQDRVDIQDEMLYMVHHTTNQNRFQTTLGLKLQNWMKWSTASNNSN